MGQVSGKGISLETKQEIACFQHQTHSKIMRIHPFQNPRLLLPFAIAVLISQSSIARATTRTVTSLGDSGAGTLRDAVMASDDGDTIDFSVTGAIGLTSGELLISKSITVTGPGANVLEVTRASGNDFRIFALTGANISVSGLTLSNGFAGNGYSYAIGGAIGIFGANLTISDCVIARNTAQFEGGGIGILYTGSVTVNNCSLTGNGTSDPSDGSGGAIFTSSAGGVTIRNSTISGNSCATTGGAIDDENSSSALAVSNSMITGNSAGTSGGAIYNTGALTVSNSTIANNSAANGGRHLQCRFGRRCHRKRDNQQQHPERQQRLQRRRHLQYGHEWWQCVRDAG